MFVQATITRLRKHAQSNLRDFLKLTVYLNVPASYTER